jgi:hypothetical protein
MLPDATHRLPVAAACVAQDTVITHLKENHDFVGRGQAPSPAVLHCLRALSADPANEVTVLSGRGSAGVRAGAAGARSRPCPSAVRIRHRRARGPARRHARSWASLAPTPCGAHTYAFY